MDTRTVNLRDLPEELVRRAKACAALHGTTLKGFVVSAIAEAIQKDIPALPHGALLVMRTKGKKERKRKTASE